MKSMKRRISLLFSLLIVTAALLSIACASTKLAEISGTSEPNKDAAATPTSNVETPAPTEDAESTSPPQELPSTTELAALAQQLTPKEIDVLKRVIAVPEYDDLELMETRMHYSPYKNLKNLVQSALEYDYKSYATLVSTIPEYLPEAMPDPVSLTPEEKNLILSQFLNQEGPYTNEELLEKTIPKDDNETAVLGVFKYFGEAGDAKTGPTFDMNLAKCETMLLFTESVGDHDYLVIGLTDYKKNRMVSIVEEYYSEYRLMKAKYKISCLHSMNTEASGSAYYDRDFDNKKDYLLYLNRYRNQVMITQFQYRAYNIDQYLAFTNRDRNEKEEAALIQLLEYNNARASAAAGLLKSMWKEKKFLYNGSKGDYLDNSPGNNEILGMGAKDTMRIENYENVLTALQSPESIPVVHITFRIVVSLD